MRVGRFGAIFGVFAVVVFGLSWSTRPVSAVSRPASSVVDTPVQPAIVPALADFDGDGRIDAVFRGQGLTVMKGQADGSFTAVGSSVTTYTVATIGPVDMNDDGRLDLLARVQCASGIGTCFGYFPGDGALGFGPVVHLLEAPYSSTYPFQGAALDVNDDAIVDLAFWNGAGVSVALGEGGDVFAAPVAAVPAPPQGLSAHIDDVDGDGSLDLVVGEADSSVTVVLHADLAAAVAGGPLVAHNTPGVPCARTCLLVDLTGDGRADLVAPGAANVLTVAVAAGGGTFAAPVATGAVGGLISPTCLAGFLPEALSGDLRWRYGDLDGDGRLDVFFRTPILCSLPTAGPDSLVHVLRYDGVGFVTDSIDTGAAAVRMPALAIPHDQNGDGVAELVQYSRAPSGALNTQPFPHLRTVFLTNDDGDGIASVVDAQPTVFSAVATDGTTTLTIVDRGGLQFEITDAVAPAGLRVRVTGGSGSGTVDGCGYTTTLTPGDDVALTCGSLTAAVTTGPIEIALPGVGGALAVPSGSSAKVDTSAADEVKVVVLTGSATVTAPDGVATSLVPGGDRFLCRGRVATVVGTAGPDKLKGTDGRDVIVAFGGDDKIEAGGGDDVVCAGAGNDTVEAGDGDDVVDAGAGNDKVEGGGGNDTLLGGDDNDKIEGGGGRDAIVGGPGVDKCSGAGKGSPPTQTCE